MPGLSRSSFINKQRASAPPAVHNGLGATTYSLVKDSKAQLFVKDGSGVEHQVSGGALETIYTATGAISLNGHASLNQSGSILVMTLASPGIAGKTLVLSQIDTGTQGHTVTTAAAGGFDGTNNTATFNAQFETLVLRSVTSTRWVIVENIGAVALSSV